MASYLYKLKYPVLICAKPFIPLPYSLFPIPEQFSHKRNFYSSWNCVTGIPPSHLYHQKYIPMYTSTSDVLFSYSFFPVPQTLLFKVHEYFKFLLKCYLIPKRLGILLNLSDHSLYFYFRNTVTHASIHRYILAKNNSTMHKLLFTSTFPSCHISLLSQMLWLLLDCY